MAYAQLTDLVALLPEETLIKLSNDQAGAEAVDDATIAAAIDQAGRVIDGYVGLQRTVPLDPVPGLIRTIAANLAVFFLYRRRNQVPEVWEKQYQADLAVLVKISTGQIGFGATEKTESPPGQTLAASSGKVYGGPGGLLEGF
ncbi:gp436 family protein [Desulfofustis glycolicus]|uniref:Mu-like prophage protein gp36 n=1 Tax=Desulfofustis glycolicus DSM 9705 TaxID=1121409 RepID=A0A1M5S4H1_9BACT|nr:DUF1320 domain-containing protein [Desulfofustis glycolicus]SHH33379.1 Mu-like prophage protein gp36 [Desulfofustis glycolicus DSM 9705]